MSIPTASASIKPAANNWPSYPDLPSALQSDAKAVEWQAKQRDFWDQFRACLDRAGLSSSAPSSPSVSTGAALRDGGSRGIYIFGEGGLNGGSGGGGGDYYVIKPGPSGPNGPTTAVAISLRGHKIFYQPNEPLADQDPRDRDLWFDTDDKYRLYEYRKGKWIDVFKEVPTLAGVFGGYAYDRSLVLLQTARLQIETARAQITDAQAKAAEIINLKVAGVGEKITTLQRNDLSFARRFRVVNAALGDANARITTEETARATADEAMASLITTLTADLGDAMAAIVTEQTVRATADSAMATSITSLFSGLGTANAAITAESTTRATADSAMASNISTLTSGLATANASIVTEQTVRSTADAAQASDITALYSSYGAVSAAITTEATTRATETGSLAAEYVLQVSTGGASGRRVAGFRITSQGGGGGGTDFVIQADKFVFVDTSGNVPTAPFKITGGTAFIDRAVITEVNAGAILAGSITAALALVSGGSLTVGTGANRFYTDVNGSMFGSPSGANFFLGALPADPSRAWLGLFSGGTQLGFWGIDTASGYTYLDTGPGGKVLSELISGQVISAVSTADPRTIDAPLVSRGGTYLEKTLDVLGIGYFNADVFINGAIKKTSNDGWSVPLYTGANYVEFQWDSGNLFARIDFGGAIVQLS